MPEEMELDTDKLRETIDAEIEKAGGAMLRWVALITAILAAITAVVSMRAGSTVNEALVLESEATQLQARASDQWAYYQAKGIKANILASKMDLQRALAKETDPGDEKKVRQYSAEQEEIKNEAQKAQQKSAAHIRSHNILARGVTFFQISIAIGAISVLTKRKWFWFVGLFGALIGTWFLVEGIIRFHA